MSASGTLALCPQGRAFNYIGLATYYAQIPSTFDGASSFGELGAWRVRVTSPPDAQPIGIVRMADRTWLLGQPFFSYVGGNTWEANVTATASQPTSAGAWPALLTPQVHCFAKPATPIAGQACAVYDDDQTLAYDLLGGRILPSIGRVVIPPNNSGANWALMSGAWAAWGDPNIWQWRANKTGVLFESRGGLYRQDDYIAVYPCLYRQSSEPAGSQFSYSLWGQSEFEIINLTGY